MYDRTDPRSTLAAAQPAAARANLADGYSPPSFGKFYETAPQLTEPLARSWITRGQNFVVVLTDAQPGATLVRTGQHDEYVVLAPDDGTTLEVVTPAERVELPGASLVFVPPGDSTVRLPRGGRVVRFLTHHAADMMALASNAQTYAQPHPAVTPLAAWPAPVGGFKVRRYDLKIAAEPGRFGRIWRCTTFMINFLDARPGRRDPTKMSPHHHDDFEQCSLCLQGEFVHHMRWPWTTNMNHWMDDVHERCGAPSVAIIPPPVVHTSESTSESINQLVDIFCPPRIDFSTKPGWVLNADEYPMPG